MHYLNRIFLIEYDKMSQTNRQIGVFMCKGETNEITCDRYTKRNNR
jgi:hypothetical protein